MTVVTSKPMEEVIDHFFNRSMSDDEPDTELSMRVKKLSNGKPLTPEQMVELIKSQLGETGQAELEAMMKKGYNSQDIVEHFLEKGKTKDEEKLALRDKISKLVDMSKMSKEEMLNIMDSHLNAQEKAMMNDRYPESNLFLGWNQ